MHSEAYTEEEREGIMYSSDDDDQDSNTSAVAQDRLLRVPRPGSQLSQLQNEHPVGLENGTDNGESPEVMKYLQNCKKYQVPVDPSVVISLKTRWHIMQPTKRFCEGAMLPLAGILDTNDHIETLILKGAGMHSHKPAAGNGNSNARVLAAILSSNTSVTKLDISNTGLDNEGVAEICKVLKRSSSLTALNVARNHFGSRGAKALEEALDETSTLVDLDVSRNALGYRSIRALQHKCSHRKSGCCAIRVNVAGNYVFEEILNSLTHAIGFVLSLIGTILLMSEASGPEKTLYHFWGCLIFSTSLMVLYLSSTLFHSFFMIPHVSYILQIADHCAIYFLIAGSYTPFMLVGLHASSAAKTVVIVEWVAAVVGSCVSISCDLHHLATVVVELTLYLSMGLAVFTVWGEVTATFCGDAIFLLAAGGAAYVGGVVFFIIGEKIPIYHVIWHVFVMVASAMHWFAIYLYVVPTVLQGVPTNAGRIGSS